MKSLVSTIPAMTVILMVCHWTLASVDESLSYGVDVSWPIHHSAPSVNYDGTSSDEPLQVLGNRNEIYQDFLQGCRDYYTPGTEIYRKTRNDPGKAPHNQAHLCEATERDRISMNLKQPTSMQNYTSIGFQKIKCPSKVFSLIKSFWDTNQASRKTEEWFAGNTYTNHWESPSYMVSLENVKLRGGGEKLRKAIWDAARETIEEWTGQKLTECSLYGIRIYEDGAILSPHVDRLPLVSSAIINVAQDVDEPWPLEVYGHDGKAYNVTMEPGDMVLYESHSVVHGRPFPLKGRFYANIFIHFEPVGHSLRHSDADHSNMPLLEEDVDSRYRRAVDMSHGGHENMQGFSLIADDMKQYDNTTGKILPPYIIPDSPQAEIWLNENPDGWMDVSLDEYDEAETDFSTGSTEAHTAAIEGDLETLQLLHRELKDDLHKEDSNGWQPLHEGARAGHTHVVQFLVEEAGANINHRTHSGTGGTALFYAREAHGDIHPVVQFLVSLNALEIGPDL